MPPLQAALRTSALVMAVAFPHHAPQENRASEAGEIAALICAESKTRNAVAESENIVAETAEKIFADLADAQTINSDKKGGWKAPLWQALSEAGLPLSWVPEDCGGSGASLAEGFSVLGAAGRFAIAVPLAETMLAGWLLAQAKIASPEGDNDGGAGRPEGPHHAQRRRHAVRTRARRALCQGRQTYRRAGERRRRSFDRAGRSRRLPDRGRPQSRRRRQRYRDVQQCRSRSRSSRRRKASTRPR